MVTKKGVFTLLVLSGCLSFFCLSLTAQQQDRPEISAINLDPFFTGMEGTFVIHDVQKGITQVYNPARAEKRFIPASTYKIANSLIALETGVVSDTEFALPLDTATVQPMDWWPESWHKEQTLKTAFQNSVYWYYQELARRIGEDRMKEYLRRLDYGNQNMGGGLDTFWLVGDLRISPFEQIDFLRRLYAGNLDVSERSMQIVKEMMVLEEKPTYRLSGKTGTAEITATKELGWLVGYLEKGKRVYVYALNMEGERVWEDWPPSKRKELVGKILEELDIMGAGMVQ